MQIIIHRGTHQIGGCVTEISSGNAKVFIDFGADLINSSAEPLNQIEGLTVADGSTAALFFTHYHGDHVGRIDEVLPELPIYMGETAKEILAAYSEHIRSKDLERIRRFRTFRPLSHIRVGDITVTPLRVDHSAFDAYMFIIEADGKRILHTGDFRLHGYIGSKTLEVLRKYAMDIDYMICENTNLDRDEKHINSEWELKEKAEEIMLKNNYVFVICTTTNIDRIKTFHGANPRGRLFVCSKFQKSLLEIVNKKHEDFFNYPEPMYYDHNLDTLMEERGFCMILPTKDKFVPLLEKYKGRSKIIYSMWGGYLEGDAKIDHIADFLSGYDYERLHTSGHAFTEDIIKVYETVAPKFGLIPIHGETPERLLNFIPEEKLFLLKDGEKLSL